MQTLCIRIRHMVKILACRLEMLKGRLNILATDAKGPVVGQGRLSALADSS